MASRSPTARGSSVGAGGCCLSSQLGDVNRGSWDTGLLHPGVEGLSLRQPDHFPASTACPQASTRLSLPLRLHSEIIWWLCPTLCGYWIKIGNATSSPGPCLGACLGLQRWSWLQGSCLEANLISLTLTCRGSCCPSPQEPAACPALTLPGCWCHSGVENTATCSDQEERACQCQHGSRCRTLPAEGRNEGSKARASTVISE